MIHYLLLLVIYIWPFGQLLAFKPEALPFTIYLLDFAVLFLSVSLIISSKRKAILCSSVTKPLAIFLGVAMASFLVNLNLSATSSIPLSALYLLRLIVYPSVFFAAKHIGFNRLKNPVIISLGIFIVICLLQYLIFPDMRFLKNIGFDDHYYRLIGPLFDPNFTGAVFAGASLFFIFNNSFLFSIPFIGLLALTFSRASYLTFIIGLGIMLFTHKKIKILLLLMLLGFTICFLPKPFGEGVNLLRTTSIFSRVESWRQGANLFIKRPILGWGYNNLRGVNNSRYQVDNSFIFILATTGIFGFLALVNLIFRIFNNPFNNGMKLIAFSILIHSLFNNSLFYIWISALFWFTLGLAQEKIKEYKKV